jgi:hypothetical protein
MVGVMAEGYRQQFWEDGPRALVCGFWASESCLHDLKRAPSAVLDNPCHTLFLYLPRGARDAIADEANVPRICDLSQPGTPLTTPQLPASAACSPPSGIPTKLSGCLSTTSCWRPGYSVAAGPGRAGPPAGTTREGDRRQSRWRVSQGAGAGMPVIRRPVFASRRRDPSSRRVRLHR